MTVPSNLFEASAAPPVAPKAAMQAATVRRRDIRRPDSIQREEAVLAVTADLAFAFALDLDFAFALAAAAGLASDAGRGWQEVVWSAESISASRPAAAKNCRPAS